MFRLLLISFVLTSIVIADPLDVDDDGKASSVNVETIHDSGNPANRLDLVFVGDGYTAAEIPAYMNMVQDRADFILDFKPFYYYQNWINIHRVDVISAESGVDNDPANGNVDVDTAMNMYIENGIGILLDKSLGYAYANLAPDIDCILAAGNTDTWSGTGSAFDIAFFCGSNSHSNQIMMHEIGHSLLHLADEFGKDGVTHTGGELPHRNVSIMNANEMNETSAKWAHWLDYSLPGIGVHDTYEGGNLSEFGVYHPSSDSLMNWLENPLNGPGIEAAILQLHLSVDPIETVSHTDMVVNAKAVLRADILHPSGHQLEITWKVNGDVVATGSPTLDLGFIALPKGVNLVQLIVVDPNPLVRDERLRSDFLTTRRAWVVHTGRSRSGACCLGESCRVTSESECTANDGFWVAGEDCNGIECQQFDSCMLIGTVRDGADNHVPPSLDIVGVTIRRLPRSLIEARIELAGPPLSATDPKSTNCAYQIFIDTETPFMTNVDWDDVDQTWEAISLGGSYRSNSWGMLDDVLVEGNTIVMLIDPSVLSGATKFAFIAHTNNNEGDWDTSPVVYGMLPLWEDVDDNGIPDHCEKH